MPTALRCKLASVCALLTLLISVRAVAQGAPQIQWERGTGFPLQVCTTADHYVVAMGLYNSILVYRDSDMRIVRSFVVPATYGTAFAIATTGAPGSTMVAVATGNNVLLYDLTTWTLQWATPLTGAQQNQNVLTFSGSGQHLSVIGTNSGSLGVTILDASTGGITGTVPFGRIGWVPTGDTLFDSSPGITQAYDANGTSLGPSQNYYWPPDGVFAVGATPAGEPFYPGYFNDPTPSSSGYGLMFPTLASLPGAGIFSFFRSHDQSASIDYISVTTQTDSNPGGYYAFAWGVDQTSGKPLVDVFTDSGFQYSVEMSTPGSSALDELGLFAPTVDNQHFVAVTPRGGVLGESPPHIDTAVYNSASAQTAIAQGHHLMVQQTAWSPNGTLLATAGQDADIETWDPARGVQLGSIEPFGEGSISSLQFASSGRTLLVSGSGQSGSGLDLIDVSNPSVPTVKLAFGASYNDSYAAISSNGSYVYAWEGGGDYTDVYSTSDGSLVRTIFFQPAGPFVVSANNDDLIDGNGVYSASTGTAILLFQNGSYSQYTGLFAISADQSMVAASQSGSGSAGPLQVVNTKTGKNLLPIGYGPSLDWRSAAFSPDGQYLYGSDIDDGEIYVFNIATGAQVAVYNQETFAGGSDGGGNGSFGISFRPDGVEWAYGRGDAVTVVAINSLYSGPTIASLTTPSAVYGGASTTGTITPTGPAQATGLIVLLSSNSGAAGVPASVTLPAGQSSVSFPITTVPVTTNTTVTIGCAVGNTTQSARMTVEAAVVTGLTVAPTSVAGGLSSTGTVTLSSAAPAGGLSVSVGSNQTFAKPPATVTVPSGAKSANFTIPTLPVPTTGVATLTATLGSSLATAQLTVTAPTLSSLSLSPTTVIGGAKSTGTVTITSAAPAGGMAVSLSSSQSFATVQATVTVPSNARSATFTVSTVPVASNSSATITATLNGNQATAQLTVNAPVLTSLTLAPTSVKGGGSVSGFVNIGSLAPSSGLVVNLSSDSAFAQVPATVTVAGGRDQYEFKVTTSGVATNSVANITASLAGVQKSAPLTVNAPTLSSVTFNPSAVIGGAKSTGTVTLGSVAPPSGFTVALSSDSSFATVPASITFAGGAKTATFSTTTAPVGTNSKATITATLNGATKTGQLTVNAPSLTSITLSPTSVVGGQGASGFAHLGSLAPTGGITVNLASDSGFATDLATVTVAAGSDVGEFHITTTAVATNSVATISGTFNGVTQSAKLTVTAPTLLSVSLNPATVIGGAKSTGTVTVSSNAPTGGLTITLSSSQTYASTPVSVTIAGGTKSATFAVTTIPVVSAGQATISAMLNGTTVSATLTVNAPAGPAVILTPATVQGGLTSTGAVLLATAAPSGGTVVQLTSSNSYAFVPESVTVPAGATSANFTILTPAVGVDEPATITAVGLANATLTVTPSGLQPGSPWPKIHGNNSNTGLGLGEGSDGTLMWTYPTGNSISGSPVIGADGTIYFGSYDHKVYALYANGMPKWTFPAGDDVETPAIGADGTIYVGSLDDNLYALHPDGSEKWQYTTGGQVFSSPCVGVDGTIYVGASDGVLYAFYPSGGVKWTFATGNMIEGSPALGPDGTIYIGSFDHYLYAVHADGSQKWRFATQGAILSSPSIASDGTVYIGSNDDNLYAVSPAGDQQWVFPTNGWVSSAPAIGPDGTIYFGSVDGNVYAVTASGGPVWTYLTGGAVWASASVGRDGTVYIGSYDHVFYALSSAGRVLWSHKTGDNIAGSPAIGFDGTIYIGGDDSLMYAFGT